MGSLFDKPDMPDGVPPTTMTTAGPEAKKARMDMEERLRRVKASHEKSKLTLPKMFAEAETTKSVLEDTLG